MIGPVLGIETSCDETSAGVVSKQGELRSLVVRSQDVHRRYGGVVPELASRDHLSRIDQVVDEALDRANLTRGELRAVAATVTPGLIGPLLVGSVWARAFSFALDVPFVPVHHMEGHLFAPLLEDSRAEPPYVALLVSGGHTMLLWVPSQGDYFLMGQTRDDAAGEAFDKVARLLELPYPGGPEIEMSAKRGEAGRYSFPRPMLRARGKARFDFSFSGLKTAVARVANELRAAAPAGAESSRLERERPHVARGFQDAAIDVLATKTIAAARANQTNRVLLSGGVSANKALADRLRAELGGDGRLFVSTPKLAMDNGAMIARAAQFRLTPGVPVEDVCARSAAPLTGVRDWRDYRRSQETMEEV